MKNLDSQIAETDDRAKKMIVITIIEGGEAGCFGSDGVFWCLMWPQGKDVIYALDSNFYHDEGNLDPEWDKSELIGFTDNDTKLDNLAAAKAFLDLNDAESWGYDKCLTC